ncbi:phage major tail tube protein [Budviciaceae bacterium CWB-B4]|uniref:Phage major tail tube protein n=1 Tax=Limnobaculum xujianqingii TaxID=2738837 RepID=A0A9D7AIE5_9GAMM|nr:phage major tail tube protein [Limnobaculum xujianqingii]MBK5073226.1 phage major tail tube protein [Limnobaculum xujianqingii]MBK5176535.1 phage major tail tube protein [Limnobaculum xujianqingii]
MSHAVIQFEAYLDSLQTTPAGLVTVDLPVINHITQELKGAGIAGAIDMPINGLTQAMGVTLNFRTVTEHSRKLEAPKSHYLQLYAAIQDLDQATGAFVVKKHLMELRIIPKNITPGKLDPGTTQDRSCEYEVLYLKESINDVAIREIDKLGGVFAIDGINYYADINKALGRG